MITQKELRRTVPSGCHVVGKLSAWLVNLSCEAKVANLQFVVSAVQTVSQSVSQSVKPFKSLKQIEFKIENKDGRALTWD